MCSDCCRSINERINLILKVISASLEEPRPDDPRGRGSGHLVAAVEAIPANLPSAIKAGVIVLAPEARALEHVELLVLDPIVKGAPEVGGHPDIHVEGEVELLPGSDGVLLQVGVSRLAVECQSVSQLIHNPHRLTGISLVDQHQAHGQEH